MINLTPSVRQVLAWHPWKYSLVCYAVVSVVQEVLSLDDSAAHPSWFVLANACKGQVLKRVSQNACDSCPLVRILAVNTHSMTFSRLTGELLVSSTTVYRVREYNNINTLCYTITFYLVFRAWLRVHWPVIEEHKLSGFSSDRGTVL